MKKKLWLTVLTFIAVFALVIGITACNNKQPETQQPEAQQLETPVVSISDEGLASWTAIENASGYAYKLDNGEETNTEATSVQLTDGQSISVKALGKDGYKDSSWSDVKTYTHQASSQKLNTPVVSISNSGLASWAPVTGATGYKYKINNGETKTATGTSVQLENGQSIKVMAVGNGTTYTDSEWSAEKTYTVSTATKLDTPDVSINNEGVASWAANDNAEGFIVKINGVDGQLTLDTSATLTDGQRIQVKAVGDGTNYTDSDWSEEKTYTAIDDSAVTSVVFDFSDVIKESKTAAYNVTTAKEAFAAALNETIGFDVTATNNVYPGDGDNLGLIKFSSSGTNGAITLKFTKNVKRVIVNCVAWQGTGGYDASKMAVNGGTEQSVPQTATNLIFNITATDTVTISSTNKRFNVYSIEIYFEDYEAKLATPTLAVDLDGVVTWGEVANATKYAYQIGDGNVQYVELTEDRSIQLTDGQTVKVWAVGNADYADSAAAEISYTMVPVTLDVPVVEVNHAGVASWHAVEGAVKYVYVINDGEEQETTHHSVQLTNGQSIKVKAVGKEGSRFQASAYCEPVTYTAPTVAEQLENPTVTVAIDGTVRIENADAVSFDYTIGDGEKQNVANGADGAAVTLETKLTNGQTIKVVAKGDGTYYTDSAEVEITYTAPQALEAVTEVTIAVEGTTANKVVITWTAVANATGYSYQIGSAAAVTTTDTTLTVTLNEGTVFSVNALGNTATAQTAADGNYSAYYLDSTVYAAPAFNIDNEKIYTVAEMVKIARYYGTATATKNFTVKGVVSANKAYSTEFKNIEITLKEGEVTFGLYRNGFDDSLLADWGTTQANDLVGCIVTATGKPVNYSGNTPQFTSGGTVTAIEIPAEIRVAKAKAALDKPLTVETSDENYTYTLPLTGEHGTTITWSFEGITAEADYTYNSENGTLVVTRKSTDVNFTATATISYTNGDDKANDTLSFELTVLATGTAAPQPPQEVSETFTFTELKETVVGENVTIAFAKGDGTNSPAYNSGIRCYIKNTITITSEATITKIVLTYSKGQDYNTLQADKGNFSEEGSSTFTGTWVGSETSVVLTVISTSSSNPNKGNCGIISIVVTYEEPNYTDQQKVDKVKDSLKEPELTDTDDEYYMYALATEDKFGYETTITWVFTGLDDDNDEYEDGVLMIARREEEAVITVKATITLNEAMAETEVFTLKIPALGGEVTPPPVEKTWQKVTNIAQINGILSDTIQELSIIITSSDDTKAMGTYGTGNNVPAVAFDKTNISDSLAVTLVKGKKDNTYAIMQGGKYLYAASSSSNYLKTEATLSDNSSWSISVASDGKATIVAQGTNTRNTMQYNSSNSGLFACYASASQTAISIWVYA